MTLFKRKQSTPAEAAALVAKLQANHDELTSKVASLKGEHQAAVLAELEGEPDPKVSRPKLQKALQAAREELSDLADALAAAKSRHAVALDLAHSLAIDHQWIQSDLMMAEAELLASQIDAEVEALCAKYFKMYDLCRKAYSLAPAKESLFGDSPIGELAISKNFRLLFRKYKMMWAYKSWFQPENEIQPLATQMTGGRNWLKKLRGEVIPAYAIKSFTPALPDESDRLQKPSDPEAPKRPGTKKSKLVVEAAPPSVKPGAVPDGDYFDDPRG